MKVQELLSSEDKWTKEVCARDSKGREVYSGSPDACRWCLIGAIYKCYPNQQHVTVWDRLFESIGPIPDWNDSATFAQVRELVERLDI